LRGAAIVNPLEKATPESGEREKCYVEQMFVMAPALAIVAERTAGVQGLPRVRSRQLLDRRRDGEAYVHRRSSN
jgi:hypothetical protein